MSTVQPKTQVPEDSTSGHLPLNHFQKVELANGVRQAMNLQRNADLTNQRLRRFSNWEYENVLGQQPIPDQASDDMNFSLDSPVTTNHYYPPPNAAQPPSGSVMSPLMKLAAVGLMASGIGIPAGIAAWNLPALLATKPTPSSLLQDYDLLVGAPPAAKPAQSIPEGP